MTIIQTSTTPRVKHAYFFGGYSGNPEIRYFFWGAIHVGKITPGVKFDASLVLPNFAIKF